MISKEKCLTIFGHPLDISTTVYGFGGLYSRRMEEEVGCMICMYQGRNHEIFLVVKNAYMTLIEMIMAIVPQNLGFTQIL